MIISERPTGPIDGFNNIFTVSHGLNSDVVIVLNGIIYPPDDSTNGFTVNGNTFTMDRIPIVGDTLLCYYEV